MGAVSSRQAGRGERCRRLLGAQQVETVTRCVLTEWAGEAVAVPQGGTHHRGAGRTRQSEPSPDSDAGLLGDGPQCKSIQHREEKGQLTWNLATPPLLLQENSQENIQGST